jgi:Ala-tRNA(Pro) deacylase
MPLSKLIQYLDENDRKYVIIKHSQAYTAQEVAASAHIPGKEMVKTVILKIMGHMKMAVLPSTHQVNFDQLKDKFETDDVELAGEEQFQNLFPDCELGAMPPFGNLYDMDTYVAESLTDNDEIAFNAGTHKELVKMSYSDFEELVQPEVLSMSVKQM